MQYKVQNIYREKEIKKARCHRNQNIMSISYEQLKYTRDW